MLLRNARIAGWVAAMLIAALASPAVIAEEARTGADAATLARIRDAAMNSDWAYQRLVDLADKIGPRLAGTPGADAAVEQAAAALRETGAAVSLQPVKVPRWERGEAHAALIDYPGKPRDVRRQLVVTALAGSASTPPDGLSLPVLVVQSFEELEARAAEAKGRIVVFNVAFDQHQADNGHAAAAYTQVGAYRFFGPAKAARLGAAAALVRSVGGAYYRLPHTGTTAFPKEVPAIPAGALAAEDSMLLARLAAQGPLSLRLVLTPRLVAEVLSHNVIADVTGREKPEEVVIVSGHLDSWDLGTGAVDDGIGVTAAMGVAHVLRSLGLQPRRTIRVIAWMGEETGLRGSIAYRDSVKEKMPTQVAAIESDFGLGRPLGIQASASADAHERLKPAMEALRAIGAGTFQRREGEEMGPDIGLLQQAGVPAFAPLIDGRRYFDYHHTAADTLDKVDPDALRRLVAVLAVLSYQLAEMPEPLPRLHSAAQATPEPVL